MKTKLCMALMSLLLSVDVQAQQEWENVNKQFGAWQIEQGLYAASNSWSKLNVKNISGEKISDTQNTLNYRSAVLNMNWKENSPFEISFTLSNEKTTPYQYGQEQVYWGLVLELYKTDGSTVSSYLGLFADRYESVSEGEVVSRYSYSNNGGWTKWKYLGDSMKEMNIKISCAANKSLSAGFEYYPVKNSRDKYKYSKSYQSFANHSNIAGIKSITIVVGSGAEVSVNYFSIKRKSLYGAVQQYIDKGDEYMQKEMYNDAVREYTNAINQGYQNADIYLRRAHANLLRNYNTSAIEDCNRALSYDSRNEQAYLTRGISKLLNHDDSGVADLRKAGEAGMAILREYGLLDYYPNQNRSGNTQRGTSSPRSTLVKDPNILKELE